MNRSGRGPRPLPPTDGRIFKAHPPRSGATLLPAPPPRPAAGVAWIGAGAGTADTALLEDYWSSSDADEGGPAAAAAAAAAVAAAAVGGGGAYPDASPPTGRYGPDGGATALSYLYPNEWLMPWEAMPPPAPSAYLPPLVGAAKAEPPLDCVLTARPLPPLAVASRPGWERETPFTGGRVGGGAPTSTPARPPPPFSPLVTNFDPRPFFETIELGATPSEVTHATSVYPISEPAGAHLSKRELADPPSSPPAAAAAGAGTATSPGEESYSEAWSPTAMVAVSRRVASEGEATAEEVAAGRAAEAAARTGGLLADTGAAALRLEWGKARPVATWGTAGASTQAPPPPPPPPPAARRTASTRLAPGGVGFARLGGGSGSGGGGAGAPPPPPSKPKRFECDKCRQLFTERSNRKKHIEAVHLKLRAHRCTICNASFAAKCNLGKHISSVHDKARPFPCGACGAAFGERNKRDKHTRTVHGGERPWACVDCGHAFGQRSDLVRHAKIVHDGVRPHGCPQPGCDKSFGRRGSLVHHLAVIHKVAS